MLGVRIVIGLVLCAVLFWLVVSGVKRLCFINNEGAPVKFTAIDLTKNEFGTRPHKGPLKVTGYPQALVSVDTEYPSYMERIDPNTYRTFYLALQPSSDSDLPAKVIVEKEGSFSGLFGYFFERDRKRFPNAPPKDQPVTVQGLAGYHISGINGDIVGAFWERNVKISNDAILLAENASPPSLFLTLLWFVPVSALFLAGVYLITNSIYLFRKRS
jgi:hypothetical protein